MKKLLLIILTAAISLSILSSCSSDEDYETNALILSNIELTFNDLNITKVLEAKVIEDSMTVPESEARESIVWWSSNPEVATCEDGVITTVGYGNCIIRASYKDKAYATCAVSIPSPNQLLSISDSSVTLENIGRQHQLRIFDDKNQDITADIVWTTSNKSIAQCDNNGVVTATGYGSCTITATHKSEAKTISCSVTVDNPTAPHVKLSQNEISLPVGETATITARTLNDAGASISWTSTDPSIATCEGGVITAKKAGICAILAITEAGFTDYCVVSVGNYEFTYPNSEYLDFRFPKIGERLDYIDADTGKTLSSSIVVSCEIRTIFDSTDDSRLAVHIYLNCVKVYDVDGLLGETPAVVSTKLYREKDALCDTREYKYTASVGEAFRIEIDKPQTGAFTVTVNPGGNPPRYFYLDFNTITES